MMRYTKHVVAALACAAMFTLPASDSRSQEPAPAATEQSQDATAQTQSRPFTGEIRAVSYNILHGAGVDGQVNLERTAEVLKKLQPDIVGLQEVDNVAERSGGVAQAKRLGELLDMHAAFGEFMDFQGGQYGMAILSRYPVQEVHKVRLPDGNEPRIALAVEVRLPDGREISIVTVHFDWVRDDNFRFPQAQKLTEFLDARTMPYILLGDFNDTKESRTLKLFTERALEAVKPEDDHFTFSSTQPTREIDFVFVAPRTSWSIGEVDVIEEPVASDHRPVLAVLKLNPATDGAQPSAARP